MKNYSCENFPTLLEVHLSEAANDQNWRRILTIAVPEVVCQPRAGKT
jgi:hypothetical protein